MITRSCPHCNRKLGKSDYHFCSACGKKLTQDVVRVPRYSSTIDVKSIKEPKKEFLETIKNIDIRSSITSFDRRTIVEFVLLLIALFVLLRFKDVVGTFRSKLALNGVEEAMESTGSSVSITPPVKTERKLTSDLELKSGKFEATDLINYVPANVSLYIEANDVGWVLLNDKLISPEIKAFILAYIGNNFVGFSFEKEDVTYWGFLFELDKPLAQQDLPEKLLDEPWSYKLYDEALVVVSDTAVFEDIEHTKEGVKKNITLNPDYVKAKLNVTDKGQLLVIFLDYKGKKAFEEIKGYESEAVLSNLIDKILNLGYNEIVLE